ncbi:methyltransferase [Roseomonas nepalensis]|uniref:Methyltransferase n=1 Tax=Muricoccus nepalensis TaxID=1854500 RepID=A0A502G985_9PROT|nr:methyltransferase [Roseomonas nepalensis]TPG58565.1 methyltransferase [Roseomonas nepalensis]
MSATVPAEAAPSWRDRALGLRDRLVSDPRFRRLAARFPPTRALARRRAGALFDLCAGFVYSQVLLACVRLRLFDLLRDGPLTAAEIAARARLPPESAARLLGAAVSLGLLDRRGGGRYGLGPLGAALPGNDGLAAMIEHHAILYADLADPVALLRDGGETGLSRYWAYAREAAPAGLAEERVADYSALMAASQAMIAEEVLDAFPGLARHCALMDVGGGEGAFLMAAAARAPALRLVLFDLPGVAARGRAALARAGLAARAEAVGGDFRAGALPHGSDLVSLVRVLHDHDDAQALALLRAAHDALPPGGRLLLAEPMAGTPGAEAMGEAYFGFYLLAMGSGRPRGEGELRAFLARAGFGRVTAPRTRVPLLVRVLVAERAG